MGKTCAICGKPSGIYPLCVPCLKLKDQGKVVKCKDCGEWIKKGETCDCQDERMAWLFKPQRKQTKSEEIKETEGKIVKCKDCGEWHKSGEACICEIAFLVKDKDSNCVICGNQANGKPQCKNCYNETKNYMDSLDKNSSVRKLRDYYYNLKERIFIIKSLEETKNQCNKLIAIAMTENNVNDDSSLLDRVYKDVESLIKGKQPPLTNTEYEEERKEKDEHKSKINTAQDGHNVDSDMEVRIDDVLYNSFILHCYGKSIDEITEKRKKCDWFIPISNGKGIYIEYWGMKTPKYLEERKEKEELYKKYNIPYISIEQDDPKQDTQTFKSNLIRELTKLAIEKFGFMPEWKK